METELRVSIIIPTKNRSVLLRRAIESALAQTYQFHEIVIIDDGSVDDTPHICAFYMKQNPKIKYIKNEASLGGAASRNIGMSQAEGDIFAFLDDDDEWMPLKLEKQMNLFLIEPEVGIVGTDSLFIMVDNNTTKTKIFPKNQSKKILLIENTLGSFTFVCLRRELFEKYGGIDADMESA